MISGPIVDRELRTAARQPRTYLVRFYALSWVGMWLGLSGRHFGRVVAGTIGRVMGLPWLVFGVFVSSSWHGGVKDESVGNFLTFWVALGIVVDLVFALKAKRRLLRELRQIAAEGYLAPWVRLGWWPFSIDLADQGTRGTAVRDPLATTRCGPAPAKRFS